MREWLTARCVLAGLLVVGAPAAALAHLLLHWEPSHGAVVRLTGQMQRATEELERTSAETTRLVQERAALAQRRSHDGADRPEWLPRRDREAVFDCLAEACRDPRVSIERLTLDEPTLYAAQSRTNLLACERASLDCTGAYTALAACLDHLSQAPLPLRVTRLVWSTGGADLALTVEAEVPFAPDDDLARKLADAAGLEDPK
ncbi:MAG: hypothetical protein AB1716_09680 [Planctomycetota bacterium]